MKKKKKAGIYLWKLIIIIIIIFAAVISCECFLLIERTIRNAIKGNGNEHLSVTYTDESNSVYPDNTVDEKNINNTISESNTSNQNTNIVENIVSNNTTNTNNTNTANTNTILNTTTLNTTVVDNNVVDKQQLDIKHQTTQVKANGSIEEMLLNDDAYIDNAEMEKNSKTESGSQMITGTGPFDTEEYGENWNVTLKSGDDNTPNNNVVRTFDTISYTIGFSTIIQDTASVAGFKNGKVYFELILPYSKEEAEFDIESMGWLTSKGDDEYKIITMQKDGKTVQVLKGVFLSTPSDGNNISIGNSFRTLNIVVRVLKMKNGDSVSPEFTFWLEGNDVFNLHDGTSFSTAVEKWKNDESLITGSGNTCNKHIGKDGKPIQEYKTIKPVSVRVSAAPRYNVQIVNGSDMKTQKVGTFDFNTGNELAPNKGLGKVNGRLFGFGITIQLYGKTEQHGLKGIEMPKGNIEFDLNFSNMFNGDEAITSNFPMYLWSLDENKKTWNKTNSDGREIIAQNDEAADAAPYNNMGAGGVGTEYASCYNGGKWQYQYNGNEIHVTISDYEVNIDSFPYANSGSGGTGSTSYIYYNPSDSRPNYERVQKACISAGEIWFVQPFYNKDTGEYILDQLNLPDGSFQNTLELKNHNLNMESISGQNSGKQFYIADDKTSQSVQLTKNGEVHQLIWYHKPGGEWDAPLTEGCFENGRDYATVGQDIEVEIQLGHDNAEDLNAGAAYDMLVKFDDTCIDLEYAWATDWAQTFKYKILYAAKRDKKGWEHYGQEPDGPEYDREMINATPYDLIFFSDIGQLKREGYTCVGVLVEYRGLATDTMIHHHVYAFGKVKQTCKPNYVYMTTQNYYAWNKGSVSEAIAKHLGKPTSQLQDSDYIKHTGDVIPSRENTNDNPLKYSDYPVYPDVVANADTVENYRNYQKTIYNEDGSVLEPYTGRHNGDSCYITEYKTAIEVNTAQTLNNSSESKKVYDLDQSERIVDFELHPKIVSNVTVAGTEELSTVITVQAILPKDLTYIGNSSYLGGTYIENKGDQGTIKDGKMIVPTLVKNEDGTTTLTWNFDAKFYMNSIVELPKIYYSCLIGDLSNNELDVKNNDILKNTVTISSTEDCRRDFLESYGNKASTTITIQKNNLIALSKISDSKNVEPGKDMGFTISYVNSGTSAENVTLVEGLPYSGEDSKSKFEGDMIVKEIKVGSEKEENTETVIRNLTFYYTTEKSYQKLRSKDLLYEDFQNKVNSNNEKVWNKLEVDSTNKLIIPNEKFSPVLIVAVGKVPERMTFKMHITMVFPGSKAGDYISNSLSQGEQEVNTHTGIISRALEGQVWIDTNMNGIRGLTEKEKVSDVTVTLMKLKNNGNPDNIGDYEPYMMNIDGKQVPATITTGNQINTVTGEIRKYKNNYPSLESDSIRDEDIGYYRFYNITEGTFGIKFEGTDGKIEFKNYKATKTNVGNDDTIDSDAIPIEDKDGYLEYAFIKDVLIKSDNITSSYYIKRSCDLGLAKVVDFIFQKVKSETMENPEGINGAKFELYKLTCTNTTHDHDNMLIDVNEPNTCFSELIGKDTSELHFFNKEENGIVKFDGLLVGEEYRLIETKAPSGREKVNGQWKIIVNDDRTISIKSIKESIEAVITEDGKILIPNAPLILPVTGGDGIRIFIVSGAILMGIVIIQLRFKERIKLKRKRRRRR